MQIELKIKEILRGSGSVEMKVYEIRKLMNWDEERLTNVINKYGTSGAESAKAIIREFWG